MVLSSVLFFACALNDGALSFAWKPEKGNVAIYDFFMEGKDAKMNGSVEAALERKVTEVKKDGSYKMTSRVLGSIVRIAGNEIKDETTHETTASFDSLGRLKEITGEKGGAEPYRHALLTQFVRPEMGIEPKGSWRYESVITLIAGLGKVTIQYTFNNVERGVASIGFVFVESEVSNGQKSSGTWWIDVKTGEIEKMEAKVNNYVGSPGSIANVRLVRRKSEIKAKAHI